MKLLFIVHSSNLVYGAAKSIGHVLQNIDLEYDVIFSNILRLKYSKNIINAFVGKNCKNIYYFNLPYESKVVLGLENDYLTLKNILRKIRLNIQKFLFLINKNKINKVLVNGNYDIIHLNSIALFPLINNKHCFIMHVREIYNKKNNTDFYKKLSFLSGAIYIDEVVKKSLNFYFKNEIILNNPIDMTKVKYLNREKILNKYKIGKDSVIFSLIGTIIEAKGIDFVIKCINSVNTDGAKFLIIGSTSSPYAKKCIYLSKNNPNIIFLGEILNIEELYLISDYIIRSDSQFCIGRTIYEGLYAGCGVLIQGSQDEILKMPEYDIYKDRIFNYKPRDKFSFIEKIEKLSNSKIRRKEARSNIIDYMDSFKKFLSKVHNEEGDIL